MAAIDPRLAPVFLEIGLGIAKVGVDEAGVGDGRDILALEIDIEDRVYRAGREGVGIEMSYKVEASA